MENLQEYWASVTSFIFYNDHLTKAQPEEFGSRIIVDKNDGLTVHLFFGDRSVIASNIGDKEYLINYDVRPNVGGYKFFDGRYVPHPNGDVKITGFFPNYQVAGLFIPVHIGPHLYFYPEPQEDIILLANAGKLRAPEVHVRRQCLTCRREISKSLGPRARYCSVECGLVTRDMLRRKRAALAIERQFTLPKIKTVRKCVTCEGDMPSFMDGRNKYCSPKCGGMTRYMAREIKRVNAEKRAMKCVEVKPPRSCQKCNGPMPKGAAGRARYCSVECGLVTRDMQQETKKYPCDECGTPFTRFGRQRFCSEKCKLRNRLNDL